MQPVTRRSVTAGGQLAKHGAHDGALAHSHPGPKHVFAPPRTMGLVHAGGAAEKKRIQDLQRAKEEAMAQLRLNSADPAAGGEGRLPGSKSTSDAQQTMLQVLLPVLPVFAP